ncbi:hypothetical protein JTE90_029317 [Oedothorax gibbosus]|uniref:Speckle-type POZ protein n=1 Tax=Oedothorax gibbosus TaxID=931172 RepID=A0AAV6UH02_9ARAC|nr:hypothetical protein JTE90_029317 [Oedothorax gibbosus]
MAGLDETGCLTFTWKIENFSACLHGENRSLGSPVFKTATANGSTWWRLDMVLEKIVDEEVVKLVLKRLKGEPQNDRCKLSLAFLYGEVPLNRASSVTKTDFIRFSAEYSFKKSAIFGENRHSFLPQDTLTVRCRIWQQTLKPGQCQLQTVLHKTNFLWNIENFNSSNFNASKLYQKDDLQMTMRLSKNGSSVYKFLVEGLKSKGGWSSFINCKLSILGNRGFVISQANHFPCVSKIWDIELYEENDLHLHLESIVAVEKTSIEQPSAITKNSTDVDVSEIIPESSSKLADDLLLLYRDRTLSDATLNTDGKSFPAHRSILGARSHVFRAMFERDHMAEGLSGVVDIDDIDSETVDRMLVFLYSDSLEEALQWEEASALYYAADKYAVQPLKLKCGDILKASLSVSNACEALVLADKHSDDQLLRCAMDFVCDHDEVVSSAEWESLEESHPRLTTKIVREMYLKNKKK